MTHRTHQECGSQSRCNSSQSRNKLEKISQKSKTKQAKYPRKSGKRQGRSSSATRTTSVLLQLLLKIELSAISTQSLVGANARIASFGTQAGKWASKTIRLRQIFLRRRPRAIIKSIVGLWWNPYRANFQSWTTFSHKVLSLKISTQVSAISVSLLSVYIK